MELFCFPYDSEDIELVGSNLDDIDEEKQVANIINDNKNNYPTGIIEVKETDNPPASISLQIGPNSYVSEVEPKLTNGSYLYKLFFKSSCEFTPRLIVKDLLTNKIVNITFYRLKLYYQERVPESCILTYLPIFVVSIIGFILYLDNKNWFGS